MKVKCQVARKCEPVNEVNENTYIPCYSGEGTQPNVSIVHEEYIQNTGEWCQIEAFSEISIFLVPERPGNGSDGSFEILGELLLKNKRR